MTVNTIALVTGASLLPCPTCPTGLGASRVKEAGGALPNWPKPGRATQHVSEHTAVHVPSTTRVRTHSCACPIRQSHPAAPSREADLNDAEAGQREKTCD